MKNKLVLILLVIATSINLYSQDYFLYISTQDERLMPLSKSTEMPTNEILEQIFKEFEVTQYYQSFPNAKTPELQHIYEIHFKGNVDLLEKTLTERKIFDKVYRCDYYKLDVCDNPLIINDPFPTPTNENALNLLNAHCAWTITKGNSNIIVGVIDSEFETTHEDLTNTFAGVVGTQTLFQNHGTSVSSCVATGINNNKGIAGIGYNTKVKSYHAYSGSLWSNIWQAYLDGIKIINVSWTGIGAYPNLLAVQEMTNNGVVLVLSAGNTPNTTQHSLYADIPGVISVSGVDANNNHGTTGTAHNQWVDVCAMSKNVTACVPGNTYSTVSGTSFASPQVAGVVALIKSVNNNLNPDEIEHIIKATAVPIADGNQFSNQLGAGRVNAYDAVLYAMNYPCNSTTLTGTQTTKRVICKEIIMQNATVPAGVKLELKATERIVLSNGITVKSGATLEVDGATVTIDPEFTVEEGATFIIK